MSATEVIKELEELPSQEREKVFCAGCNSKASKICGLAQMP